MQCGCRRVLRMRRIRSQGSQQSLVPQSERMQGGSSRGMFAASMLHLRGQMTLLVAAGPEQAAFITGGCGLPLSQGPTQVVVQRLLIRSTLHQQLEAEAEAQKPI